MSMASYRRNEARGVTGPYLPTCFPASLEQMCPYGGLRPKTYRNYLEFIDWYYPLKKTRREANNEHYKEMMDVVAWDLGKLSCEDLVFKQATTPRGMERILRKLWAEDYSVIVDIRVSRGIHAVGVLPTPEPNFVTLVSNQIPPNISGVIPLSEVTKRMHPNNDKFMSQYPFNNANITALPPAA